MSSNASSKDNNVFAPFGNKRTRSQLPNLNFDVTLQSSPLKDARQAIRKGNNVPELDYQVQTNLDSEGLEGRVDRNQKDGDSTGDDLDSISKKRPCSPSTDQVDTKRTKFQHQSTLPALFARQNEKRMGRNQTFKPLQGSSSSVGSIEPVVATPPLPAADTGSHMAKMHNKFKISSKKIHDIPYLDLTTVSPSRKASRSASPGKLKLRIVSEGDVTRLDSEFKKSNITLSQDSKKAKNEQTIPEAKLPSNTTSSENDMIQQPPLDGVVEKTSNPAVSSTSILSDNTPSERPVEKSILHHGPPANLDISSVSDATKKAHNLESPAVSISHGEEKNSGFLVSLPPLSPLTPLPPTPESPVITREQSQAPKLVAPIFSDSESGNGIERLESVPGPSRLPRLSVAFPPIQDVTANAHSAANVPSSSKQKFNKDSKQSVHGVKATNKRSESSSLKTQSRIHMTRSATLRQIQVKKHTKKRSSSVQPSTLISGSVKPPEEERRSRDTAKAARAGVKRSTSCPPDSPVASSSRRKNPDDKSIQNPNDPRPPKRRKRFVLTVPSSLSPVKPTMQREKQGRDNLSSPGRSVLPPPITDAATRIRSQTTLSNLSTALEKLAQPAPARPNTRIDKGGEEIQETRPATSMGFDRVIPDIFSPPDGSHQTTNKPAVASSSNLEQTPKEKLQTERDQGKKGYIPSSASERAMKTQKKISPPTRSISSGSMVTGRHQIFGVGGNPFSRPSEKASRKTSLSTVPGSPTKPGQDQVSAIEDQSVKASHPSDIAQSYETEPNEKDSNASCSSVDDSLVFLREKKSSKDIATLASRRASMAFSSLSQSIPAFTSNTEETILNPPPRSVTMALPTRALRSNTSFALSPDGIETPMFKENTSVTPSTAPVVMRKEDVDIPPGAHVKKSRRAKMPGSLDVLKGCTIFVDVKTEGGEDAGSLFVDMLRGLGAKILARVGQSCTHLIYKNGLQSTLTRYRLLEEPRPHVVGIGWVVECVEKREKVDEMKFQIELDDMNVSGTSKRRRSLLPKQVSLLSGYGSFIDDEQEDGVESSFDESISIVGDNAKAVVHDNIPPLEKARRRSLMLSQS